MTLLSVMSIPVEMIQMEKLALLQIVRVGKLWLTRVVLVFGY